MSTPIGVCQSTGFVKLFRNKAAMDIIRGYVQSINTYVYRIVLYFIDCF